MLKIDCKQVLKNFKGEALKSTIIATDDLAVGEVVSTVLGGQTSNSTLAWTLGKKFATEDTISLKAEEVVFVKKEMEDQKHWMSIVAGQVLELLDGPSAE